MTAEKNLNRRKLIQAGLALPAVAISGCASSQLTDENLLRAEDPVARSLLYYPSTEDVPADHPLASSHQPDQTCATCIHIRGNEGEEVRKCPIYPGRLVNAGGWCSVWAKG